MVFYVATSLDLWPQTTYNLCAREELPARFVLTNRLGREEPLKYHCGFEAFAMARQGSYSNAQRKGRWATILLDRLPSGPC